MGDSAIKIRLMKADDFDAVMGIVEKITDVPLKMHYDLKFEKLFKSIDYLPVSLVAEKEDGSVIGFVMGELYQGDDGIFPEEVILDAICVDPSCRHRGIGESLIIEFTDHLRKVGVRKILTFADPADPNMIRFYNANRFNSSKKVMMEQIL